MEQRDISQNILKCTVLDICTTTFHPQAETNSNIALFAMDLHRLPKTLTSSFCIYLSVGLAVLKNLIAHINFVFFNLKLQNNLESLQFEMPLLHGSTCSSTPWPLGLDRLAILRFSWVLLSCMVPNLNDVQYCFMPLIVIKCLLSLSHHQLSL